MGVCECGEKGDGGAGGTTNGLKEGVPDGGWMPPPSRPWNQKPLPTRQPPAQQPLFWKWESVRDRALLGRAQSCSVSTSSSSSCYLLSLSALLSPPLISHVLRSQIACLYSKASNYFTNFRVKLDTIPNVWHFLSYWQITCWRNTDNPSWSLSFMLYVALLHKKKVCRHFILWCDKNK